MEFRRCSTSRSGVNLYICPDVSARAARHERLYPGGEQLPVGAVPVRHRLSVLSARAIYRMVHVAADQAGGDGQYSPQQRTAPAGGALSRSRPNRSRSGGRLRRCMSGWLIEDEDRCRGQSDFEDLGGAVGLKREPMVRTPLPKLSGAGRRPGRQSRAAHFGHWLAIRPDAQLIVAGATQGRSPGRVRLPVSMCRGSMHRTELRMIRDAPSGGPCHILIVFAGGDGTA